MERQQMEWREEGNRESENDPEAAITWWPEPTDASLNFEEVDTHILMNILI